MMTTDYEKAEKVFYTLMKQENIPTEDTAEGVGFVCEYMSRNTLTDDNRKNYWLGMAVAAYHAGKQQTVKA